MGRKRSTIGAALLALAVVVILAPCCRGGKDTDSSDNKASGGAVTSATLRWNTPTSHVDGTPFGDLAGFKVTYADDSGTVYRVIDMGMATSLTVSGLPPNTYSFTVSAYDASFRESDPSNPLSITFR
jgi:hypothetical protein